MNPFARLSQVVQPVRPFPAGQSLACAFPPRDGLNGACTTIADLARHGLKSPLWTPTKKDAVRLIGDAAMERVEARGHGNAAARRARSVMDQHRLDAESEAHAEARIHRNTRPQRHD